MPSPDSAETIAFADFDRIDIRVGRIVQADLFPEARKPAFKLLVDAKGNIRKPVEGLIK